MAFEGGPNEIGKVSVGIEANMDALRRGLEQAKQEATQKAGEIQQALKVNPLGYDTTPEKTGPSGGAAAAYGYGAVPPTVAAEAKKQVEEQARSTKTLGDEIRETAGYVALLTANFQQFFQIGQNIGGMFAGATKQALEFQQALDMNNASLEKSLRMRQEYINQRIGGDVGVENKAEELVQSYTMENASLQAKAESAGVRTMDFLQKGAKFLISGGFLGSAFEAITGKQAVPLQTERDQILEQIAENDVSINQNRRDSAAFTKAQASRRTVGGRLESAAGLEPGSLPPIGTTSKAGAAYLDQYFKDNPDAMNEMIRILKMSNNAIQQQAIDAMNGNRKVDYR